jgi:hypothetical protein
MSDNPTLGAELLSEVERSLRTYVIYPSDDLVVANTLWIASTHVQPVWHHATRQRFKSPQRECGKTTAQDVTSELSYNSISAVSISRPRWRDPYPSTILRRSTWTSISRSLARGLKTRTPVICRRSSTRATGAGSRTSAGTLSRTESSASRRSRCCRSPELARCPT